MHFFMGNNLLATLVNIFWCKSFVLGRRKLKFKLARSEVYVADGLLLLATLGKHFVLAYMYGWVCA